MPMDQDQPTEPRQRDDSGRESQPADQGDVLDGAERVERLDEHSERADDAAGIVPTRTQETPPAD